jgi:hypothetical protein
MQFTGTTLTVGAVTLPVQKDPEGFFLNVPAEYAESVLAGIEALSSKGLFEVLYSEGQNGALLVWFDATPFPSDRVRIAVTQLVAAVDYDDPSDMERAADLLERACVALRATAFQYEQMHG